MLGSPDTCTDNLLSDDVDVNTLLKANPKTKLEWQKLARQISTVLFQRLHTKPLYDEFAVEIAKQAAAPLNDRDVRKIGTAMTVLSNEKQKEAKAAVGGKKKVRRMEPVWRILRQNAYLSSNFLQKAAKPVLGASKDVSAKYVSAFPSVFRASDRLYPISQG